MMYLINTKFFYMFLSPMLFLTTILTPELTGSLSAQLVAQKEKKNNKKSGKHYPLLPSFVQFITFPLTEEEQEEEGLKLSTARGEKTFQIYCEEKAAGQRHQS